MESVPMMEADPSSTWRSARFSHGTDRMLSTWATESLAMEGSNKDDRKPRTEMWLAAVRLVDRSSTCNGQQPNVSCVVLLFLSGSIDGLVSLFVRSEEYSKNYCFSGIFIRSFHFKQVDSIFWIFTILQNYEHEFSAIFLI